MIGIALLQTLGGIALVLLFFGVVAGVGSLVQRAVTPRDLISRWHLSRLPEGGSPIKILNSTAETYVWVEEKEHWAKVGELYGIKADSTPYKWRRI